MGEVPASTAAAQAGQFRPPVVPRARAFPAGETLPLEHHIEGLLGKGIRGPVNLFGPAGSGKSTALAYVAARFPADKVLVLDEVPWREVVDAGRDRLDLFASRLRQVAAGAAFELAPWGEDDVIEDVLHAHREACKSIMSRVRAARDHGLLEGLPQLWAIVLEEFAGHEALREIRPALRHFLGQQVDISRQEVAAYCMDRVRCHMTGATIAPVPENLQPLLLRHDSLVYLLASEQLAAEIGRGNFQHLTGLLPPAVVRETAQLLKGEVDTFMALDTGPARRPPLQPGTISLLLEIEPAWKPTFRVVNLTKAHLAGARWPGVNLKGAALHHATFSNADLNDARLSNSRSWEANFSRAKLTGAVMEGVHAAGADYSHADLTAVQADGSNFDRADFQGAKLLKANFNKASFTRANLAECRCISASFRRSVFKFTMIDNADFSSADFAGAKFLKVAFRDVVLAGARFGRARLKECELEGVRFSAADFRRANLAGSYLTGSVMPGADFRKASLRECGLAEVEWENADLRGADLTNASFHLGSSRSGLVHSVLASEGTRTGFYTDDYNDQDFKAPEEIRKANLTGCDLRGAKVEGADFYLVDLRRAKYTPEQGRHFARCGAILRARA